MKKALVLAGGFPQIELIKQLKTRGFYVILADYTKKPVAVDFADKFYCVSTLDVEKIKQIAIDEKVDGIITVCTDQALLTVAKVSEELKLPCYIDYKTALNVTNKQYMKKVMIENGISTSKFFISDVINDENLTGLKFPLIVKPVDCNSSKGVLKVANRSELDNAFENAKNLSRTKTAIVEEFISGTELTVDAYVENGKATVLSVSVSEKIKDNTKFVIFRTCYPANISEDLLSKIKETVQKIADVFKLSNCPLLVQMLTDGVNPYVIEFSARTGGGVKYLLIKEASGFDVIKAVIDLTFFDKPHLETKKPDFKFLTNEFLYCKEGIFDHLENFSLLKEKNVISDYYLFKTTGSKFDSVSNSGDRIAGFTLKANSFEDLAEKHAIARKELKVIDNNNNDILRHDLLIDLDKDLFKK